MTSGVAGRVVERGEIWIDGARYALAAPVQKSLASQFPPKLVLGDYKAEDNPYVSTITWSDFSGGLGKEVGEFPKDINRFHWGRRVVTEVPGKVFIGPPVGSSSFTTANGSDTNIALVVNNNILYGALDDSTVGGTYQVVRLLGGADTTSVRALAGAPTDFEAGRLNDTITLAVATDTGVDYSNGPNDTTWSRNTTPMRYLAFLGGNLFGINSSGDFSVTANLGSSWTDLTRAAVTSSDITGLITGPQADGRETVYLVSRYGLDAYDKENEQFVPTPLHFSYSNVGGQAATQWRGKLYWASGQQIYSLAPGSPSVVEQVGPNVGVDGIPFRGDFLAFATSPLHLFASYRYGLSGGPDLTFYILRYNGVAWHIHTPSITAGAGGTLGPRSLAAGYMNSSHQIVTSDSFLLFYRWPIPIDTVNPRRSATQNTYSVVGTSTNDFWLSTPWLRTEGDQENLALRVLIDSIHPSTSQSIQVKYVLDDSSDANSSAAYTALGIVDRTGIHTLQFPRYLDAEGMPFRSIRLRADLYTTTSTSTPELNRMTLVYKKSLPQRWGFVADLKLDSPYKGHSPKQMRSDLETSMAKTELIEVTYRNQEDATENFMVQAVGYNSAEQTGHDAAAVARVTLVEIA